MEKINLENKPTCKYTYFVLAQLHDRRDKLFRFCAKELKVDVLYIEIILTCKKEMKKKTSCCFLALLIIGTPYSYCCFITMKRKHLKSRYASMFWNLSKNYKCVHFACEENWIYAKKKKTTVVTRYRCVPFYWWIIHGFEKVLKSTPKSDTVFEVWYFLKEHFDSGDQPTHTYCYHISQTHYCLLCSSAVCSSLKEYSQSSVWYGVAT